MRAMSALYRRMELTPMLQHGHHITRFVIPVRASLHDDWEHDDCISYSDAQAGTVSYHMPRLVVNWSPPAITIFIYSGSR